MLKLFVANNLKKSRKVESINKIILRTDLITSIFSLALPLLHLRKVSTETFFEKSFTYQGKIRAEEETRRDESPFSLSPSIRSPIADPFSTRWVLGKPWTTVPFLRKPATPSYVRLCQGERAAISVDRPPRCNYRYTAGCADTGGPFCNDHNRSIGLSILPPPTRFFCRWKRLRNPYATLRRRERERGKKILEARRRVGSLFRIPFDSINPKSSIISGIYLWYYEIYVWLRRLSSIVFSSFFFWY